MAPNTTLFSLIRFQNVLSVVIMCSTIVHSWLDAIHIFYWNVQASVTSFKVDRLNFAEENYIAEVAAQKRDDISCHSDRVLRPRSMIHGKAISHFLSAEADDLTEGCLKDLTNHLNWNFLLKYQVIVSQCEQRWTKTVWKHAILIFLKDIIQSHDRHVPALVDLGLC